MFSILLSGTNVYKLNREKILWQNLVMLQQVIVFLAPSLLDLGRFLSKIDRTIKNNKDRNTFIPIGDTVTLVISTCDRAMFSHLRMSDMLSSELQASVILSMSFLLIATLRTK